MPDAEAQLKEARQRMADLTRQLAVAKSDVKAAEEARDTARKEAAAARREALATWAGYIGAGVFILALAAAVASLVWQIPVGIKVIVFVGVTGLVVAGGARLLVSVWSYLPFLVLALGVALGLWWALTRTKKLQDSGVAMAGGLQRAAEALDQVAPQVREALDADHLRLQMDAGIKTLGDHLLQLAKKKA